MNECPYCWGSHGCDLNEGHEGDHECLREHLTDGPDTRPRGHHEVFHFRTDELEAKSHTTTGAEQGMKYGPNTETVERIIDKIHSLTLEQDEQLKDAWGNESDLKMNVALEARVAAWTVVRHIDYDAAWAVAQCGDIYGVPSGTAWNVARHAVLATMARGLITEDQFDSLYGPWSSVMD